MKPIEVLRRARDLITDPNHWVTRYYAATHDGKMVDVVDPRAERFCAIGAVYSVSGSNQIAGEDAELELRRSCDLPTPTTTAATP